MARRVFSTFHLRLSFLRHLTTKPPFTDANPLSTEAEALLTTNPPPSYNSPALPKALSLLTRAVAQNSPRAKTLLASMHREGLGVKRDIPLATSLFTEAAESGDPVAQCSLGSLLLQCAREEDESIDHRHVSGTDFAVDVASDGTMRGRLTMEGPTNDAPTPAALVRRVRKERRKAGFTDAQAAEFELHRQQKREQKLQQDTVIAIDWLEIAAAQGNDVAMVMLGNEAVEEDPPKAMEWYQRAIKAGRNTDAYFNVGHLLTNGAKGIEKDPKAAFTKFAMAAQLGNASAQFYLGHLYRVGSREVDIDEASARQYIDLAADQGHPAALHYLALMHRNGEGGLEPSQGTFMRYLTASAKGGYAPAHTLLGDMYYKGEDGVEVDYERALQYFKQAGDLGEADAFCSAAAMNFHGIGTAEDHHEAFLLYQKAAELGSIQALRNIGTMYFHGHGVPANQKVAEHFFVVADENEAKLLEQESKHLEKSIENMPAPKHPMADIPDFVKKDPPMETHPEDSLQDSALSRKLSTMPKE